jgi:hypothetical protein
VVPIRARPDRPYARCWLRAGQVHQEPPYVLHERSHLGPTDADARQGGTTCVVYRDRGSGGGILAVIGIGVGAYNGRSATYRPRHQAGGRPGQRPGSPGRTWWATSIAGSSRGSSCSRCSDRAFLPDRRIMRGAGRWGRAALEATATGRGTTRAGAGSRNVPGRGTSTSTAKHRPPRLNPLADRRGTGRRHGCLRPSRERGSLHAADPGG